MKASLLKKIIAIIFISIFSSGTVNALDRIIIKYKVDNTPQNLNSNSINKSQLNLLRNKPLSISTISQISQISGVSAQEINQIANGGHVIKFNRELSTNELNTIVQKLKVNSNVSYVEIDKLLKPALLSTANPLQWDMLGTSVYSGLLGYGNAVGDDFAALHTLWNNLYPSLSPGNGVVVAVIDTGYTPHPAFINNLVTYTGACSSLNGTTNSQCYGYNFISDCRIAGSCPATQTKSININPAPDGLDLGDFISNNDANTSFFSGCSVDTSSWHGSHVTGTIVANNYNNSSGILGGAYGAKVLPLRVLGKCGGYTSDIANAIYYAVNDYPGLTNPNPAKVINMSIGGYETCSSDLTMQNAINDAVAKGAIVVVAAGNSGDDIANYVPAGCNNVISVAAKAKDNSLAWYSNYGNTTITASGGGAYSPSLSDPAEIYSSIWSSSNAFNSHDIAIYAHYEGTSMATPHVSAAVADLIAFLITQNQTYSYSKIVNILQGTASQDYTGGPTNTFGGVKTGMLDAGSALTYATNNFTNVLTPANNSVSLGVSGVSTVLFTNNTSNLISVANAKITGLTAVSILSDGCANTALKANNSCGVSISSGNLGTSSITASSTQDGILSLVDTNGNVISSMSILYTAPSSNNSTTSPVSSGNNGGGCAMVQNGNDYSLLLLLILLSIVYVRKKLASKN